MVEVTRDTFFRKTQLFPWRPFTQTDAYTCAVAPEETLHYFIDNEQQPALGCIGIERRKFGLKMLVINGEVRSGNSTRKVTQQFYGQLTTLKYDYLQINLNTQYTEDEEIALRTAGLLRPVGMFSAILSKIISTQEELKLDKSWRRNLTNAEQNQLQ